MALRNISEWKADHIRLVLFSDKTWLAAADTVFKEVFGQDASDVSEKRAIGESIASGTNEDGLVSIVRTINRLDVVLQAVPNDGGITQLLSEVGNKLDRLVAAVIKWVLNQEQAVVRVAVSGRMLLPTSSTEESYSYLREYIQVVQIDSERFRDLQFQVNLAKQSATISDLKVNRLTGWGALFMGMGLFQPGFTMQNSTENHFCSCVTDMNTDRDHILPFKPTEVVSLLRELSNETIVVLTNGIS